MPRIKVNLLNEDSTPVDAVETESTEKYAVNDYFTAPDGGVYLICGVRGAEPPLDLELDTIWIDGPRPTPTHERRSD